MTWLPNNGKKDAGYSYDAETAAISRKRKLAEALMQAQGPAANQMAGGMVVKNSPLAVLAPLLQQQLGAKMDRDATRDESTLQADRQKKLGEWLQNMPGKDPVQPVMPTTGFSNPANQQTFNEAQTATNEADRAKKLGWALQGSDLGPLGQGLGGAVLQSEFAAPDIKYQDAGDSIVVLRNGVEAGRIKKGASPDSLLSANTAMRGQDISAGTAIRGQDLTAATTTRGQDLTAQTTTRGQDIGAENSKRSSEATIEAAKLKATGSVEAKKPVLKSLEYTLGRFADANKDVSTGGVGGIKGAMSKAFDYQDAAMLDNLSQQISTELRTIFRIPGEGSLSEGEQAQYGLQLPSRNFSPEQNKQIMLDLENRARLRMGMPTLDSFDQNKSVGASGSWESSDGWSVTPE